MVSWPPMLYQMSLIDDFQLIHLTEIAWKAWSDGNNNDWDGVNDGHFNLSTTFDSYFPNTNWYNILDLYKFEEDHENIFFTKLASRCLKKIKLHAVGISKICVE